MVMTVTAAEAAASGEVESEAGEEDGSWKTDMRNVDVGLT